MTDQILAGLDEAIEGRADRDAEVGLDERPPGGLRRESAIFQGAPCAPDLIAEELELVPPIL